MKGRSGGGLGRGGGGCGGLGGRGGGGGAVTDREELLAGRLRGVARGLVNESAVDREADGVLPVLGHEGLRSGLAAEREELRVGDLSATVGASTWTNNPSAHR